MGEAGHPGVLPIEKSLGAVLLGIVEGKLSCEVLSGEGKLSEG